MIIISNKPGQLGNLLFVYANLKAYCIENNITLLNPAFYQYQSYFNATNNSTKFCNRLFYYTSFAVARVLDKSKIKLPFISVKSLDWDQFLDLDQANDILNGKLCFIQGWQYRGDKLLLKHRNDVKLFFKIEEKYQIQLNNFWGKNFKDGETVVGIHIRRGDYQTFENGKYFYSVSQYANLITELAKLFQEKNPHFMVCSNESIRFADEEIKSLKITYAPGHELLDLHCLVNCHFIAGPPSTYSMWASFYGNVPLCILNNAGSEIKIGDFKTIFSEEK